VEEKEKPNEPAHVHSTIQHARMGGGMQPKERTRNEERNAHRESGHPRSQQLIKSEQTRRAVQNALWR
jgi:hypothetical protein